MVSEEYYERDQRHNSFGVKWRDNKRKKVKGNIYKRKTKQSFICLYVNPQKRKVSELLAGECLEYHCDVKNCVILCVILYLKLPSCSRGFLK